MIGPFASAIAGPVATAITSPGVGGGGSPSLDSAIRALFANGEQGGMWDATQRQYVEGPGSAFAPGSDANSRLYQIMDAKELLTPSAELTPVTFASATGWTTSNASVVISGGVCTWTGASTGHNVSCTGASSPIGAMFLVEIVVDSISSGGLSFASGAGASQTKILAVGINTFYISNRGGSLPNPTVYSSSVSTNAVISKFSVKRVSTATSFLAQQTTAKQPRWKDMPSHYADFDAVDDAMIAVLPAMGSNCTVASVGPGGSPSILTGQTIGAGDYTVASDFARYLVINRALTGPETAALTAWLTEGASA